MVRLCACLSASDYCDERGEAFDLKGMEGEIVEMIPRPISATLPIKVKFETKFFAHLQEEEIEVI